MKVFITGGTGFIGSHIIPKLVAQVCAREEERDKRGPRRVEEKRRGRGLICNRITK
jgi:nucleoside-diphosphate-sugar epimerase